MRTLLLIAAMVGLMWAAVAGEEPKMANGHSPAVRSAVAEDQQQPTLPKSSTLPGVVIILILGMFLAAAVIGPVVRANMPEEMPETDSHEEPQAAH